jgi:hypothetical protein
MKGMNADEHDARLAAVAARLGVVPAGEFVAVRAAAAKEVEDPGLAAAIVRLRKPVLAAWVVNLLADHDAAALAPATELADEFRAALDSGDARALSALNTRRRHVLRELTDAAVALAADHDVVVSAAAREAVERTLDAALRDPDAAAAVMTARLLRPIDATGMDAPDLTDAVSGPFAPRSATTEATDDLTERRAARDAARATADARRHAEHAERELARVTERGNSARDRVAELEARLAHLDRERAHLQTELDAVASTVAELADEQKAAREAARRARKAADRLAD